MMKKRLIHVMISLLFLATSVYAKTYTLKDGQSVYGSLEFKVYKGEKDLYELARSYDVAYDVLMSANPGLSEGNYELGSVIVLPTMFMLPNVKQNGMVVNLAERRLYLFRPKEKKLDVFPVSIGRSGWETPLGKYKVIEKTKDPIWFVPKSLYDDQVSKGVDMPKMIKPGPDNPLGKYSMRLSHPTYLIHGTNDPNRIGRKVTAGCINMYPEDIEALFRHTAIDTPVNLINQPMKLAFQGGKLYLESHKNDLDWDMANFMHPETEIERAMKRQYAKWQKQGERSDQIIYTLAEKHSGVPIAVKKSNRGKAHVKSSGSKDS
ncbi:MAG: L,D-transpeptidase family protein [Pseudomonadota bacterium]|nr:L,D-transpeptidase family protein [Pseudomonadota bacterium]